MNMPGARNAVAGFTPCLAPNVVGTRPALNCATNSRRNAPGNYSFRGGACYAESVNSSPKGTVENVRRVLYSPADYTPVIRNDGAGFYTRISLHPSARFESAPGYNHGPSDGHLQTTFPSCQLSLDLIAVALGPLGLSENKEPALQSGRTRRGARVESYTANVRPTVATIKETEMKCIKRTDRIDIYRVPDHIARILCRYLHWEYVSKREWREQRGDA